MRKKFIAALLAVCMIAGLLAVPATASTFDDVADDHWAASAIERWSGYGVLNGNDDGTFAPDRQMTRAEFAQMLVNLLGLTKKGDITFGDVKEDAWYADVISIAFAAGILTGDNGNARPGDYVSFNEAVVMMARAFGLKAAADAEDAFPDAANWAKDALNAMAAMGAIGTSEEDQINPAMSFDRAAVAAIADNVIVEYVNEDREEPITGEINGVVLVVNNAKVEIKDAVITAPIVVESASVTLTGTTAADIIVSGTEASVTADEESKVENVTVGGEAPVVDIQGEIASVTIAEGATEVEITAPNVPEDAIVNESTSEATVNGETVEAKPEEPAEEPSEGDGEDGETAEDGEYTGSVSGSDTEHTHRWSYTAIAGGTQHEKRCSICGVVDGQENHSEGTTCDKCGYSTAEEVKSETTGAITDCVHTWVTDSSKKAEPATCTEAGITYQICNNKKTVDDEEVTCGATRSVVAPATGHTWADKKDGPADDATCVATGYKTEECSVCHTTRRTTIPATGLHTWGEADANGVIKCTVCQTVKPADPDDGDGDEEQGGAVTHTYVVKANSATAASHVEICSCSDGENCTTNPSKTVNHTGDALENDPSSDKEATCSQASVTGSKVCKTCGQKIAGTTGSTAAHDYSVVRTPADETNNTPAVMECKWCHKTAEEVSSGS